MNRIAKYFKENQREIMMALYSMNLGVNSWQARNVIEHSCR